MQFILGVFLFVVVAGVVDAFLPWPKAKANTNTSTSTGRGGQ